MQTEFTIPNSPVIYVWKCIPEETYYIGQAIDAKKRHNEFIKWDKRYAGPKINEMREKYPSLQFWKYEILIELPCDDEVNDNLNNLETSAILVYMEEYGIDNVLNMNSGGGVLRMFNGSRVEYLKQWREKNKEKIKEYYQKNREHIKERAKKRYEKNKDSRKEQKKEWYEKNKEHEKERMQQYKKQHYDEIKEYRKRWAEEHKDEIRKYHKEYYQKNKKIRSE